MGGYCAGRLLVMQGSKTSICTEQHQHHERQLQVTTTISVTEGDVYVIRFDTYTVTMIKQLSCALKKSDTAKLRAPYHTSVC